MKNLTLAGLLWDSAPKKMELLGYKGEEGGSCNSSHSFDLYVNFLWIFAGIYALSKLTQLLELYLGQRLISQKSCCDVRSMSREWEQTLLLYEEDKCQLEAQVQSWREKNLNLEQTIKDLRDCNINLISENFMRCVMQEQVCETKTWHEIRVRLMYISEILYSVGHQNTHYSLWTHLP